MKNRCAKRFLFFPPAYWTGTGNIAILPPLSFGTSARMSQENLVKLECGQCHRINYHSRKNKKTIKQRLELKKFCNWCKKHVLHKETK